jgi:antitoxin component YwqK of YwqJK toxin-antitoxin module
MNISGKMMAGLFAILCIWLQDGAGQDNDIKDGFVQFFYPNGQVSSEGMMVNGKPEGFWRTYYVTGIKKSEGNRKNHLLDSIWIFYNNKEDTLRKISYMYGKKNGYYLEYSYDNLKAGIDTGIVISKELYVNDKKEGISYYCYNDGTLKSEVSYVNGKMQGLSRQYEKEGNIITLIYYHNGYMTDKEEINRYNEEGQKDGVWKEFYPDGKVKKEEHYKDGLLDGLYKEFNKKGNLVLALKYNSGQLETKSPEEEIDVDFRNEYDEQNRLVKSGAFRNNVPIGVHREYDITGKVIASKIYNDLGDVVSEGVIDEEGNRQGPWKDYYKSGKIRAEGNYLNNNRSGEWRFYFANGKLEQKGKYLRGRENGLWTWCHENGRVWREEEFFNGRENGILREYDEHGKRLTEGYYVNGEKEGSWYYRVGDHIEVGNYITGLRDGMWKYFYADSTLKFEGYYVQGNPDGKHKLYYPDGALKEERIYVLGLREKIWKRYDELGNVYMTITYKDNVETRINGVKLDLPERDIKLIQ